MPGGSNHEAYRFATTRWSVVVNAGGEGDGARDALSGLCETYRPPVLAYIRAHVQDPQDAEDLTQAFFAQLLERRFAERADPERGRFRAFLLTALKHFLSTERERARAQRRGGGAQLLPGAVLEDVASSDDGPEQAFEREWARTVLREAMQRLGEEAKSAERAVLFAQLRPYLVEVPGDGDYETVARTLGLRRNTVAVAVHRLRTRLQELVLDVVADTAGHATDIDAELRRMRDALMPASEPEETDT